MEKRFVGPYRLETFYGVPPCFKCGRTAWRTLYDAEGKAVGVYCPTCAWAVRDGVEPKRTEGIVTEKEIEQIAERVAALVSERSVPPELRVYSPIEAVRLIGCDVQTDRAARRILAGFGIPTIPRSPGGKLRGVAAQEIAAHIERLRAAEAA